MCLKKARRVVQNTFALMGYDDDFPSTLFAGWITVKKFKARHINHAKTLGRKIAKKLRWNVWKVRKVNEKK